MFCLLKRGLTLAGLAALGLTAAHPAAAGITVYNFQAYGSAYSGQATLGNQISYTGNYFNSLSFSGATFSIINALDSTGAASTVGLSVAGTGTYQAESSQLSTTPDALLDPFGLALNSSQNAIVLTGLAKNAAYTLDFYSQNGHFGGRTTTFTIGSTSQNDAMLANDNNQFDLGHNYVTFTGTTDANGNIFASYQSNSGEADFNGLQIAVTDPASPAPEPSQYATLGFTVFGVLTLMWKSRRRKAFELAATPIA